MNREDLLILRAFVPGRLDEIADIYGDVVSRHVLESVGDGHLYDNADVDAQAPLIADALRLPVSVRLPARILDDRELESIRARSRLFATPHGEKLLTAMDAPGFVRSMLKRDIPSLIERVTAAESALSTTYATGIEWRARAEAAERRVAELESRLRDQPIAVLARIGAGLRDRE